MISEKLASFYTHLEDRYFNVLDFLDHKGVPVYTYSDFFEEKGIPSFIVSIAIVVMLLLLLSLVFVGPITTVDEITLTLRDTSGRGLQGVTLSVSTPTGEVLINNRTVGDGETLQIVPQLPGTKLLLRARKNGYHDVDEEIIIGAEDAKGALLFKKDFIGIEAIVGLSDSETDSIVTNAVVTLNWDDLEWTMKADQNGIFRIGGVPEDTPILITVRAEGYTELKQTITFIAGVREDLTLLPSGSGFVGKASVIITVSDDVGSIDGATITVYNRDTEVEVANGVTTQGAIATQIQTGIPLRIVVEAEGYLTYDSDSEDKSFTLRRAEEKIDVIIAKGGEKLIVNVLSDLGLGIDNAVVQLFYMNGNQMNRKISKINGVEFNGLDPSEDIYVTASHDEYLPGRIKVNVGSTEIASIILQRINSSNSTRIDLYALDKYSKSISGAKIKAFEITDTNKLPYGIDEVETSIAGYVNFVVAKNKTYEIIAETATHIGSKIVEIGDVVTDNKVYISMSKKPNVVELELVDPLGGNICGTGTISALSGENLFDGNIVNSRIVFNSQDKEVVELALTLCDGNTFTENVYVKGKDIVEVVVYNKESDLSPAIEYIGLENENGDEVQGVTPGAFYWAKFSVKFPRAASQGGVHFRAGEDTIPFADSGNVSIYQIDMAGAEKTYSYSYSENEVVDRSNTASEGESSKWAEGIIDTPNGTYIVKVKLRVTNFTAGKIPLHYRAWANIQDDYHRTPEDLEIGKGLNGETKSALYATTLIKEFNSYESLPECNDNICVAMNFLDGDEVFYDTSGFEAQQGKIYALEAEFSAKETDYLQVTVTTDNNLSFIGTQNGTFDFVDNLLTQGKSESTIALSVTKDSKQKVRFYFIGEQTGGVTINFVASGNAYIEKDLFFNVVTEKKLLVELSDMSVELGKNFTVKVYDEGLSGVENAFVKIMNKQGEVVKSVVGNGGDGTGKNGNYRIENTLDAGLYSVEVSAPKYKTETTQLLVSVNNVLTFPEEIDVKMMVGQKTDIVTKTLENLSELNVTNLSYEVSDNENFEILAVLPPTLGKSQKANVQINIEYVGSAESTDEIIEFKIKGYVEGKFLVETTTSLNIIYNRQLDSDCLKLEPSNLTINLIGHAGSSDSDVIEATNNCEQQIMLTKRVKEKSKKSYVAVDSDNISLQPGQTANITINAHNLIERGMQLNENYNFEIIYDSNYLTKRLDVKVNLINPNYSLSCPGQVTLWMSQNSAGQKATAAQPLYITNSSQFPIQNIGFSIQGTGSGASLSVEPSGAVNLEAGQTITPTKVLFAQGNSTLTEPMQKTIVVTGRLGNLNNRSGQRDLYGAYDNYYNGTGTYNSLANYTPSVTNYATGSNETLCTINATVYYSGFDCLKVNIVDDPTFNLSAGNSEINLPITGLSNSRKVSIQNNCAEPVRIVGVTSQAKGLLLGVQPVIVSPGTMAHTQLSVGSTNPNMNLKNYPVFLQGITDISQTPIQAEALNIDITSGDQLSQYSKATKGLTVKECVDGGDNKEITIDVPNISSGDCSSGYCDALQATEYIAKKLDLAIRKAESYAYSKQSQSETFGCETQGFCTFAQVGMKQETFDLYLQNDIVSVGALREALGDLTSNQTSGIRGGLSGGDYRIEMADVSSETINFIAGSGYGKQIFIDDDLQGCGYYKVRIDGSFPVAGSFLSFQTPVLVVRAMDLAQESGLTTNECIDDIVNLANFTPIDKGFTANDTKGTWLTTINSETNLKAIGEELAEKHFKDKTRVTTTSQGNKIRITEGALTNALAEVCILGGEKKTIDVKVNSNVSGMSDTEKEAFQKSLSKMISDSMTGSFGNNCLVKSGEGHNCVRLTEAGDIGRLKLDIPDKIMLFSQGGGCVLGDISSPIPESLTFSIRGENNEIKDFGGIKRITIEDVTNTKDTSTNTTENLDTTNTTDTTDTTNPTSPASPPATTSLSGSRQYYYEIIFNGTQNNKETSYPIELTRNQNSKDKRFMRKLKICAYPTLPDQEDTGESTYITANGATFVVTAMNKSAGEARGTEDSEGTIKINAGTIHPDDLVKLLTKNKSTFSKRGEDNPYYFTINWNDSAKTIPSLQEYYLGLNESGQETMQGAVVETTDGEIISNKATASAKTQGKRKAIYSYLGWCSAVSAGCNATTGFGNSVFGVVADCVIPATTIFRKDMANSFEIMEAFYEWAEKIPVIGGLFSISDSTLPDAKSWNPVENPLIAGGILGAVERELVLGYQLGTRGGMGIHNTALLADTANALKPGYKMASEKLIRESFTNLDNGVVNKFSTDYSDFMAKEFEKYFKKGYEAKMKEKSFAELTRAKAKVLKTDDLTKIINQANVETQNSAKTFFRQPLSKTDSTTYIDYLTSNGKTRNPAATADDILKQLTPGSQLGRSVGGSNPLNSLDNAITTRIGDLTGEVSEEIVKGRASGSIFGIVDDMTKDLGISSGKKLEIVDAIQNRLNAKFRDVSLTSTVGRDVASGSTAQTVVYAQGTGAAAAGQRTVANIDDVRRIVRESVTETVGSGSFDDVFKLTSTQLDDVGRAMTAGLADSVDDIAKLDPADILAKRGLAKRVGSLFKNGKFWGAIARGALCGIASNAVGINYYNKSLTKSNEELHADAAALGDFRFEKGKTYKMIVEERTSKDRIDATYEEVKGDLVEEMIKALGNKTDNGVKGTPLVWSKALHNKKPEERKLSLYLLKDKSGKIVSTTDLETRLQDRAFDLKESEIDEIMDNIRASTSQSLIYRYSVQENSKLDYKKEIYADIIIVAPLIAALGDDFKESEKIKELNLEPNSTFLKDKVNALLEEMSKTGNGEINEEVAKKIFDKDPKKADTLFKVSLAWGDLFK